MTLINRRTALMLGLAGGVLAAATNPASALVQIVVSGANFAPLPIAIPDFGSSDPAFGREIADIVRANLRPEDRAARLGGEEFCLVFQGMTPAEASALAERIRGALEATPPLSRAFGPPTVSAGVAIAFGGDDTFDTLLRRADTALYEAKQDGRNRVEGPTPRLVA